MENTLIEAALSEGSEQLTLLQKTISEKSREILRAAFSSFFREYPEVKTIYWESHIPSFNDGDPCEFTLGDIHFSPADHTVITSPFFDDENEDPELKDFEYSYSKKDTDPRSRDMAAISKFMNEIQDYLKTAFGSDTFVRVTPFEMIVEDYDCGY